MTKSPKYGIDVLELTGNQVQAFKAFSAHAYFHKPTALDRNSTRIVQIKKDRPRSQ